MASAQQGLKKLAETIEFLSVAVLLSVGGTAALAQNTAYGTGALAHNTTGTDDSAFGFDALFSNTSGISNTAVGSSALLNNTTGFSNTATGDSALTANTSGANNTAYGIDALAQNTTGHENTATGAFALEFNDGGYENTASGTDALFFNGGYDNTVTGFAAMENNGVGHSNTANGAYTLQNNNTGNNNTASGFFALRSNSTGFNNTALGFNALKNSTIASYNIALGFQAGLNLKTGSNNIDIGSVGVANDANTVRIGTQGTQTRTFIAGVSGILSGGSESTELAVNRTTGQIGVIPSSARFKRDIHNMGSASAGLMKLRPVTFRYKDDPSGTLQYGLIAEEVARVYPNLVVHDSDGKVQSVRYLELSAMLLNELQKQTTKVATQQREIDALSTRLATLEQQARTTTPPGLRSLASK